MLLSFGKAIKDKEGVCKRIDWFFRKKDISIEEAYLNFFKVRRLYTFGQYLDKLKAQGWRII